MPDPQLHLRRRLGPDLDAVRGKVRAHSFHDRGALHALPQRDLHEGVRNGERERERKRERKREREREREREGEERGVYV